MLSDVPIGLLPAALTATVAARIENRPKRATRLSDTLTTMTFASACAAAAFGIWDWLTMPRDHPAWTTAIIHGSINATGVALLGTAMLSRKRRLAALAAVGGSGLAGAWFGGEIVFGHGWRVKPAEELEIVAQRVGSSDGSVVRDAEREIESFEREKTFLAR